jgi:hypothetical protein
VYMDPSFLENLRINAERLVKSGVARYETNFGKLEVNSLRERFINNSLEITLIIIDRVLANEEISIIPLKNILLKSFFDLELELDSKVLIELYTEINREITSWIRSQPGYKVELVKTFDEYLFLVSENVNDYAFYSGSTVTNILQTQPEYQYSEIISSFTPIEVDQKTIYTLFSKERYWEYFSKSSREDSYVPLNYAKTLITKDSSDNGVSISYEDLIVYNNQLYKLKPNTVIGSRSTFSESEWVKYVSKRFNTKKSFKSVYSSSIRSTIGKVSENGFDVNSVISDSSIQKYRDVNSSVSKTDLVNSFGGEGRQIAEIVEQLQLLVNSFGGYQGSLIGGFEYIAEFSDYLLLAAFGRNVPKEEDFIGGSSIFGKFNLIFASKTSVNKIAGLKFLDGFANLKSFVQAQKLSFEPQSAASVRYNPIYEQFLSGVDNSYEGLVFESTYLEKPKTDLLLYSIESLYRRCNLIGDLVQGVISTLGPNGETPGYEGLGSIEVQFKLLQNVFPPSKFFLEPSVGEGVAPGFTGLVRYLLNNYVRFSKILIDPTFPGKSMEFLLPWIDKIINKLEELVYFVEKIGIGVSSFIPNLSFKTFLYDRQNLIEFLKGSGFRDSEINQLLNVESFEQLVRNFAPLSDSSDLKSFFKAYELTQLIYEMGGEEGINAYLSFLYSTNSIDSLLNILDLSTKQKSVVTYTNIEKYPRLIGLLIGLTYAIDPQQLVKFNNILQGNNLSLLESISFIFQQGEKTIIKSPEEIRLLQPMIEQMITGQYKDTFSSPSLTYSQINSSAPISLKSWTKLIGDNLGQITSTDFIQDLYDRSVGLTPKELITILNNPQSPNVFGTLIDGFDGGEFTKFLKYVNLTGLGFKLGFYKNSYQADNFEVKDSQSPFLLNLLSETKTLTKSLSVFKTVLDASFDYNFKYNELLTANLNPFIRAQNKDFEVIPTLLQESAKGTSLDRLNQIAGDFKIVESPGIGNSRLPNRVPALNSITPEQANILLDRQDASSAFISITQQNLSLIEKFIKFSSENAFASDVFLPNETQEKIRSQSTQKEFKPATKYEINGNAKITEEVSNSSYVIPEIYKPSPEVLQIVTSGLGVNYIRTSENVNTQFIETFDRIKSCEKFGGSNCSELYADAPEKCAGAINKSLLPEEYVSVPGVSPGSVIIDRPLGTFAEYKPSETLLPLSSVSAPPTYMGILPQASSIGEKAEPILNIVLSSPLIFEVGDGSTSEYNNTEFGGVEFIKAQLEKNSEFNCASFESPFYYQLCMNIMKCKRFDPALQDKKYLDFCPKSLSGGRLK